MPRLCTRNTESLWHLISVSYLSRTQACVFTKPNIFNFVRFCVTCTYFNRFDYTTDHIWKLLVILKFARFGTIEMTSYTQACKVGSIEMTSYTLDRLQSGFGTLKWQVIYSSLQGGFVTIEIISYTGKAGLWQLK